MKKITTAALLLLLSFGSSLQAQKFYPDDPLTEDNDRLDTPAKPAEIELSDYFDRFGHMFHDFGASPMGSEAQNVNTLDEVPNSSWFTNRHGVNRLTIEELRRGPNHGSGLNPEGTWKVIRGKSQGLTALGLSNPFLRVSRASFSGPVNPRRPSRRRSDTWDRWVLPLRTRRYFRSSYISTSFLHLWLG